ncbi:MAG: NAD(+)/NADH kinase [Candidatus Hodarchaeaceae archaeon]|nr:NAD(+)/NADH kinase [Candidatus Hodarchaeaceae archaeon]
MRIGIVARPDLPEAIELTQRVLKLLSGEDVVLDREVAARLDRKGFAIPAMRAEVIITIGGDGTVLATQQRAPNVPILGINMGGTGFLADVPPGEALRALRKLLAGELQVRERARLAVEVAGKRLSDALNEAVVRAASPGRMLAFKVLVDGEVAESTRGDGVIIATPTGSTAYAIAAGGPIVDPCLEAMVVVPVCTSRPRVAPLVVPMSSRIEVELPRPDCEALVIVDGQSVVKVSPGSKLSFHRSENPAKFLVWGDEFYRKVREKL